MVKVYTIGMMEHNAKNDPTVVAAEEMLNGALFTIDEDHKSVAPTADGTDPLYIALNKFAGDDHGQDLKIAAGAYVNAYQLKAWDGMYLEISQENIVDDIDDLDVGDVLVADTTYKFKAGEAGALSFNVAEKIMLGTAKGVRVQIVYEEGNVSTDSGNAD